MGLTRTKVLRSHRSLDRPVEGREQCDFCEQCVILIFVCNFMYVGSLMMEVEDFRNV
jgi:hypothetical protein